MIVAKPVIDKQFWILQKDNEKVGNVEACAGGYQVKINNQVQQYKTIKMAEKNNGIQFLPYITSKPVSMNTDYKVYGYRTKHKAFNPVWNVQYKLPIYTTEEKSKSWLAAGWYKVKKGRNWSITQDPKLILLERYPYKGPFYNREEAENV